MGDMNDKNWHGGILLYTALLIAWASLEKQKETAALIYSKPPFPSVIQESARNPLPVSGFFLFPAVEADVSYWFTTSINYKCYTNVRGAFDFDKKTGWIVTKLGHFKNFLRNGEKSGAAHAAPPIPYGYSIARICSIRDCFFCLRIVHTDKISSIPNNTRMNSPISKTGNL